MAITKVTTPDLIDLPFNNTDGIVLAKGTTDAVTSVQYLVVAGGGAGGYTYSGGGGAGGLLTATADFAIGSPLDLTIGIGGVGTSSNGNNGADSVFSTITSDGGGGGASNNAQTPSNGGSGGGNSESPSGTQTPGQGTPGQGYNGGTGYYGSGSIAVGGGGGGAGGLGVNAASGNAGNGGIGLQSAITGTNTYYAGGGGGAGNAGGGTGGSGIGGDGNPSGSGSSGTANTGSGGGASQDATGGAGGSGIVILRTSSTTTATFVNATTTITQVGGGAWSSGDKIYTVTATTGVATVSFSSTVPGTGRPTGLGTSDDGTFRYNTTTKKVEYYDGANWFALVSTMAVPQAGTTGICNYPTTALALYQLNGGVGSNVPDTCGSYNGTANAVTYTTGKFGQAADLTATNGSISIPGLTNSQFSATNISVSAWVNMTSLVASGKGIYLFSVGSGSFQIQVTSSGINFYKYLSTNYAASYSTTLNLGQWYHIVATASTTTGMKLYLNGSEVGSNGYTGAINTDLNDIGWGYYYLYNDRRGFSGLIDQGRIFPSALTVDQVGYLYEETAP